MWAMPDTVVPAIRAALPEDWTLESVAAPVSSRGDGGSATGEAIRAAQGAEIYLGAGIPRDVFLAARPTLRWAHSTTAGISSFLYEEMREADVAFTNSAGVHGAPIAETVLAMMLYFARGLDFATRSQALGVWEEDAFNGTGSPVREIAGATLVVIGSGGIGGEVDRRAQALGLKTVRLNSQHTRAELEAALRAADYLLVAVPDTERTRGMIGRTELALLQAEAVLINVARGSAVDEPALAEALREGRLRGAGLDVFAQEPLPASSPLWHMPNVLITPHVSAVTRRFWDRQLELILGNLECYLKGQPLRNLVDKKKGY